MVGKKAPILLLDAFRRAAEHVPELTLDYIGGGDLLPAAIHYVHAFGLSGRVKLHGNQPSSVVKPMVADADLFLQHSVVDPVSGDEEGLPVAILEAMAQGLAVVTTRHAGIPEAVIDGQSGLLIDEGDVAAMSEAIVCLGRDAAFRQELGRNAWEQAGRNFSWARERERLLKVLGLNP
jgi:glycosyltransferase involved in cell wall biosynthesis